MRNFRIFVIELSEQTPVTCNATIHDKTYKT